MPVSQPIEDLTKLLPSLCLNKMESSSNQWGVVDLNAHVVYFNPVVKQLFGLKSSFDEVGRHYKEIPHLVFESHSDNFYLHDSYIVSRRRASHSLQVHNLSGGWKAYVEHWTPIFDRGNKIVGLQGEGKLLDDYWLTKIGLIREKMKLESPFGEKGLSMQIEFHPKLSQRETEVLFLLMLEKSKKEIANCLTSTSLKNKKSISTSTVYTYVNRLKEKFGVSSDDALIEYVFHNKYQNYIPPAFFHRNMSLILD